MEKTYTHLNKKKKSVVQFCTKESGDNCLEGVEIKNNFDNLRKREVHFEEGDINCVICDEQKEESIPHIFFRMQDDEWHSRIRSEIQWWLKVTTIMHNNPVLNFLQKRKLCLLIPYSLV